MSIGERIVAVANSYLTNGGFAYSEGYNSGWLHEKKTAFGWNDAYSVGSHFSEIVWKEAYGDNSQEWKQIDRLFTPSPIATHTNCRGSRFFKTGGSPYLGAIAVWNYGWHSYMGIVAAVTPGAEMFDMIIAQHENGNVKINFHLSRTAAVEYKKDGYNLTGFIYPKEVE